LQHVYLTGASAVACSMAMASSAAFKNKAMTFATSVCCC
jgi:hypothetical protein